MSTTATTTTPRPKKRQQLTPDQRILVIAKRAQGKSYRSISEETNISKTEATAIVKRWESNRELRPRPGRRPKKGLGERDRRRLVQIREEWPGASVREIWDAARVAGVGVRTVGRFLRGVERERKRIKRDGAIRREKGGKKEPKTQLLHTPSGIAIIEIQGTINLPQQPPTATSTDAQQQSYETPVGRLIFPDGDLTSSKQVYLYIGKNQRLTGEVKKLATPLGVMRRRDNTGSGGGGAGWEGEELEIFEIVRWKLLFSQRPEPVS